MTTYDDVADADYGQTTTEYPEGVIVMTTAEYLPHDQVEQKPKEEVISVQVPEQAEEEEVGRKEAEKEPEREDGEKTMVPTTLEEGEGDQHAESAEEHLETVQEEKIQNTR